jgi:hypothetical protein
MGFTKTIINGLKSWGIWVCNSFWWLETKKSPNKQTTKGVFTKGVFGASDSKQTTKGVFAASDSKTPN